MTVSVDVTRENNDPFWSGSFDRKQIGQVADYVIMMGYEEHWGGSQVPGSVASLPWVKEGTELLMKDVPAHKILLGVPFIRENGKRIYLPKSCHKRLNDERSRSNYLF